jgi:hypothetical protein
MEADRQRALQRKAREERKANGPIRFWGGVFSGYTYPEVTRLCTSAIVLIENHHAGDTWACNMERGNVSSGSRSGIYFLPEQYSFDFLSMKMYGASYLGTHNPHDDPPDVRDGLTSRERIILQCLDALQKERGGRPVPTGMLYGSVVEHVDMSVEEMQRILVRLIGHPLRP